MYTPGTQETYGAHQLGAQRYYYPKISRYSGYHHNLLILSTAALSRDSRISYRPWWPNP